MTYNEVMALVMPSIIALLFYIKLRKSKLSIFEGIGYLSFFMLTTNCIGYAMMIYLRKIEVFIFTNSFTMKYSMMATFIAIIMGIICRFVELNLNVKLHVETKNESD